ncbi:hypothetical protein DdX_19278 [Ditylenchus destructor]|uniref:F-box domain-containing protein n=1 Tax=Ditylenchus destructor TaxID=166010 RepID=A0AAD4QSE1_9BILA|nr:hypothetical protein DdX_19278 [Ditylenchus destructor]
MSSLPNEIFYNITNFLPNDDITDLMLMSRNFNALVTPRLKKIEQEIATMNQSVESFMPSPAPDRSDHEWISQLNLERFEPIGYEASYLSKFADPEVNILSKFQAKKRMREVFENHVELRDCVTNMTIPSVRATMLPRLKERMSLDRFDDPSFLRIVGALVAKPKFRQEYNVPSMLPRIMTLCYLELAQHGPIYPNVDEMKELYIDVLRILSFYQNNDH